MMRVDVTSLEGIRYLRGGRDPREGVDCLWASRMALTLIFEDFEARELPMTADEEAEALAAIRGAQSRWKCVGGSAAAARRIGDLIYGRHANGTTFVAVLVDQVGMIALTAIPERGVCKIPLRRLEGVHGVFRRGAA